MSEERHFRTLEELSLIDNFLFGLFMQEATEEEIKEFIECLLTIKIKSIKIIGKQHNILNRKDKHSIYLDAYVEDDEGHIYNIEVQVYYVKGLGKRMRFHQSMIDREQIPSGSVDFSILPETIIIFITSYDPFGKGLYRYTFKTACIEDGEVNFGDGTTKVVLNPKGKNDDKVPKELRELLHYIINSTDETAEKSDSELVKKIHKRIKLIKSNSTFGDDFMSYQEELFMVGMEREEIGEKKGKEIGEKIGKEIGEKIGKEIGEKIGEIKGAIRTYFKLGKTTEEAILSIIDDFSLSRSEAEGYVKDYCASAGI